MVAKIMCSTLAARVLSDTISMKHCSRVLLAGIILLISGCHPADPRADISRNPGLWKVIGKSVEGQPIYYHEYGAGDSAIAYPFGEQADGFAHNDVADGFGAASAALAVGDDNADTAVWSLDQLDGVAAFRTGVFVDFLNGQLDL